ncbi:MAG: hypothetical protein IPK22_14815 [Verrucomicrobiaceae bacterium]|nr:hypothetical protein [Verrucomicrobiaceae bacterium]
MKSPSDSRLSRNEFLRLTTGILAGLGIPGVITTKASAKAEPLSADYLAHGLTAMARAQTWFDAHWGAGVLAGYYLCRDHPLDAATVAGIQREMNAVMEVRAEQFSPMKEGPVVANRLAEVTDALRPAMRGGLRAHGHAVIFASLATRALRDAPQMARAEIIEPLCGISRQIAKLKPQRPAADAKGYTDTQTMIETAFDNLVRFQPLLGHPEIRRPNFTHMITHTEALMNLEQMGFADLAREGHLGHRVHLSAAVPVVPQKASNTAHQVALERVMNGSFWSDAVNTQHWNARWNPSTNPNGDWIASGHLFKVLYSHHRLLGRIADAEKAKLATAILLERYTDPSVQGG